MEFLKIHDKHWVFNMFFIIKARTIYWHFKGKSLLFESDYAKLVT